MIVSMCQSLIGVKYEKVRNKMTTVGGCLKCKYWNGPRNFYFGDPAGKCSESLSPRKLYKLGKDEFMKGSEAATVENCPNFSGYPEPGVKPMKDWEVEGNDR